MAELPSEPRLPPPPPSRQRTGVRRRLLVIVVSTAITVAALTFAVSLASTPTANLVSQRSLCQQTDDLLAEAESAPDVLGTAPLGLEQQMPDDLGFGLVLPADDPSHEAADLAEGRPGEAVWVSELTANGYEHGLERSWSGPYTAAATEVLRFGSHAGALGFQHWIIHASCRYASDVFAVSGLPGSIGLRLRWENGDVSEQVSFVRGPYRYLASTRTGQAPPRWWVEDITHRLASSLGMSWSAPVTPCDETSEQVRLVDSIREPQPPRGSTPKTLLPSGSWIPGDTSMTEAPKTRPTHEPVFIGVDEVFEGAWRDQLEARRILGRRGAPLDVPGWDCERSSGIVRYASRCDRVSKVVRGERCLCDCHGRVRLRRSRRDRASLPLGANTNGRDRFVRPRSIPLGSDQLHG